jgi:peptidoglycan/LPS O-acetylase OafA/YrhL
MNHQAREPEFNYLSSNRIPSLDGLRALSIGMVLAGHSRLPEIEGASAFKPLLRVVSNGALGVSIFFVISGFLITTLLLKEEEETGGISLRDFYVRRSFRILPAFLAYLGVLLVLKATGAVSLSAEGWFSALIFLRNYLVPVEGVDWVTAHCWSLSVEEQFYLVWPVCLILLGRRRATWLAAGLIVAGPFSRMITFLALPGKQVDIGYMTHTRVDTVMFGRLAALLARSAEFRGAIRRVFALRLPMVAAAFAVLAVLQLLVIVFPARYLFPISHTVKGVGIVLMLLWVIERPETPVGRLLNSRVLVHIGVLSYSIYLWQQWILSYHSPWSLPATLVAAECSYFLIERPFLRLRQRFLSPRRATLPLAADPAPVLRPSGLRLD